MMESQNRVSVPRIACLAALTASVSLSCRDGGTGPDEPLVDDVEFVAVDAGAYHTCALSATDVAYCWGANYADQLGVERPPDRRAEATPVETEIRFLDIAVGAFWTCGLATGGAAHCWGDNSQGYLGDNSTIWRSRPTRVSGGHAFSTLEAGFYHTCGLTAGGSVYCWGYVISAIRPTPHRVNSDVAFV